MKLKYAYEGTPWLIQFRLLRRVFFLAKFPHFSSMLSFSGVFLNFVPYSRSLVNIGFCHFRSIHVALITISCAFTWKILFKLYKLIQSNFSPSGFFLIFRVLKMTQKNKLTCLSNVLVILNAIGLIPTVIKHYKMKPIGLSVLYTDFTEVSKEYQLQEF